MIKAGYDNECWYIAIPRGMNQELTMLCYLKQAIQDTADKMMDTEQLEAVQTLVQREISTIN